MRMYQPLPVSTFPSWRTLSAAPHRAAFLGGATQLMLAMTWWLVELMGRIHPSWQIPTVIPPMWAHGFLMLYGVFPFFIYGFLFTVFPRWMGVAPVPPHRYMVTFVLAAAGMGMFYVGLFSSRGTLAFGLFLYLGAWINALGALWSVYRRAHSRSYYEMLLLIAMAIGAVGPVSFGYGVLTDTAGAYTLTRQLGLWGYLLPVVLIVSHRMLPFFTNAGIPGAKIDRTVWTLWLFAGGSVLHGIFDIAEWVAARFAIDAILAAIAFHHSWAWGLRHSLNVRLVAMLHVAFLWFGISMALFVADAALLLSDSGTLGRAPLHALTIGLISGMLIAMATRVTLGHSGRPLVASGLSWYGFLGINMVAFTRIVAEVFPAAYLSLNIAASIGWLVCLLPWVWRYAPMYFKPRADHQIG